jgi:alpha-1,3-rhamnosyl/mannosyltransferase
MCDQEQYDLYHEPNFIPFSSDRPTIATLHDLSVLLHPEWHPADRVAYYEQHFRRGLGQCIHFLAVSEFTRQEVIRTLNIPPERITRTYNGIRSNLRRLSSKKVAPVLRELGLPPRYLLYVGTIEPRKNVLRLLRAYCSLPATLRSRWPLLLVGNWGWTTSDVADYLDREARHRGVVHIGYVRDKYLAAIYNGARALLYPSLYEGFGLPPLEMMACGGAVVASTAGAVKETVGRHAHLVDPEDSDGWRNAMLQVLQDDDWWRLLRKGVTAVARSYSWDRCAAETLAVYESLAGVRSERWATGDSATFERISVTTARTTSSPAPAAHARAA